MVPQWFTNPFPWRILCSVRLAFQTCFLSFCSFSASFDSSREEFLGTVVLEDCHSRSREAMVYVSIPVRLELGQRAGKRPWERIFSSPKCACWLWPAYPQGQGILRVIPEMEPGAIPVQTTANAHTEHCGPRCVETIRWWHWGQRLPESVQFTFTDHTAQPSLLI